MTNNNNNNNNPQDTAPVVSPDQLSTEALPNLHSPISVGDRLADPIQPLPNPTSPPGSDSSITDLGSVSVTAEEYLNGNRDDMQQSCNSMFNLQAEAANHMNPDDANKVRAELLLGMSEAEQLNRDVNNLSSLDQGTYVPIIARDVLIAESKHCDKLAETIHNVDAIIKNSDPDPIEASGNTDLYNSHMKDITDNISDRQK
jgi:hypothetical protein